LISEAMEINHGALITVHHVSGPFTNDEGDDHWSKVFIDGEDLLDGAGDYYLLRSISGLGQELPEGKISGKNPVAYYLRREHHPLLQYDVDLQPRFHIMEPAEREWLSGLNMDVFVPIYAKDTWIGLLALGSKTSGDRYYDEDLDFLQTLADQTAVALENARLYQDLKMRNLENERLNEELKTANTELARLDRAKSDFINIASHELRTPLTQVIGYNDILGEMIKSDDLQPAVGVQMVESVRRAARRLEEIVETMFDVSKLDTKTLDLMRAPVSISSVITVAIDTWSKGLEERKLTVSVRGLAGLPTIVADGKRLTQVFSHLIQNAIKSTPDGGQIRITGRVVTLDETPLPPRVALPAGGTPAARTAALANELANIAPVTGAAAEADARAHGGNTDDSGGMGSVVSGSERGVVHEGGAQAGALAERYVEVIVADTGIGIAPDELERIFEKFYRVGNVLLHSTGETKFKGAGPGLGLTIARGIVEAHDGRIWAESSGHDEEHCPGSRFHVLLPIHNITHEQGDQDGRATLATQNDSRKASK
jgi:signal transduction histidine kinase